MSTTVSPASQPDLHSRLRTKLSAIHAPDTYDSAWIGPFEQLVGAAFSLIESENRGYSKLTYHGLYHPNVQKKIISLLTELEADKESSDNAALQNWLSRYYFNSGIQRVNFAAERLIATYASLPCSCSAHAATVPLGMLVKFKILRKAADALVLHAESKHAASLPKMKEVLKQLSAPHERTDPFNPTRGLAMIRQDVNRRKHSAYKRSETLDSLPAAASGTATWADAGFLKKMEVAVSSLELVADAYAESLSWCPQAKL